MHPNARRSVTIKRRMVSIRSLVGRNTANVQKLHKLCATLTRQTGRARGLLLKVNFTASDGLLGSGALEEHVHLIKLGSKTHGFVLSDRSSTGALQDGDLRTHERQTRVGIGRRPSSHAKTRCAPRATHTATKNHLAGLVTQGGQTMARCARIEGC